MPTPVCRHGGSTPSLVPAIAARGTRNLLDIQLFWLTIRRVAPSSRVGRGLAAGTYRPDLAVCPSVVTPDRYWNFIRTY
jgi:hypothetical protein